jgi:hypothetical protein
MIIIVIIYAVWILLVCSSSYIWSDFLFFFFQHFYFPVNDIAKTVQELDTLSLFLVYTKIISVTSIFLYLGKKELQFFFLISVLRRLLHKGNPSLLSASCFLILFHNSCLISIYGC